MTFSRSDTDRHEHLLVLYRHLYWNGGYFGCIFQVRALLPKAEVRHLPMPSLASVQCNAQNQQSELLNNFISGSVGGFAGTALNTPYVFLHPTHSRLTAPTDSTYDMSPDQLRFGLLRFHP